MESADGIGFVERPADHADVRVEQGIHEFKLLGVDRYNGIKQLERGDTSGHYWNRAVLGRVRKYKPILIGSDSFEHIYQTEFGFELTPFEKLSAWYFLPGSPEEISGQDHVYSVAADYFGVYSEDAQKYFKQSVIDYGKEDFTEFVIGVGMIAGGLLAVKNLRKSPAEKRVLSRRSFLKKVVVPSGIFLASLPLVRWSSAFGAGLASDRRTHDILTKIAEVSKHGFSSSTWADGRTAMIIAKTIAASDLIPHDEPVKASVLLGFPHVFNSGKLLDSKEYRQKKVKEFVEMLKDTIDLAEEGITRDDLNQDAIDYFSPFTVVKIKEPAEKTPDLGSLVSVHAVGRSSEVEEALR